MWSFKDRVLLPHSPTNYLTWKLDRDYSPINAQWHSIDKFFHTATRGDESLRNLLIAACAAVLQGRADLQKAFYLFGSGANGKGSFMRLLEMLIGDENTHSTSLENICENRFEVANLYNKRLVICPDEDRRIRGLSTFKSVTGGDSLRGEEKGMKAFKFKFQGTVVLASNNPIFMGDDSYGLSRRLIPIPFAHTVPKSERRDLTPDFTADLPGFTTYLLGLDRDWVTTTLRQANDIKAIDDLTWELTIQTDSIAAFYDEQLIYDPQPTTYDGNKVVYEREWVLAANAYKAYRQFCSEAGFVPKHQNNFGRSLVNLLVDKLERDVSLRKTRVGKVIEGLRLRTALDPICDSVTANLEKTIVSEFSPKPPTVDRPIPAPIKVSEDVEYQIIDGEVQWLEIHFFKHAVGKDWKSQLILWGCQTKELDHRQKRRGNKWLLVVKEITIAHLEQLLTADLGQSSRQPSRR